METHLQNQTRQPRALLLLMEEFHTMPLRKGNWDESDVKWLATHLIFFFSCALM